jgi:hypothetical protein
MALGSTPAPAFAPFFGLKVYERLGFRSLMGFSCLLLVAGMTMSATRRPGHFPAGKKPPAPPEPDRAAPSPFEPPQADQA